MRIKTVKIEPDGDHFRLSVSQPSDDMYVDEARLPSANGFYSFDCDKYSDDDASLDLVNCMISRHDLEIRMLNDSRASLESLRKEIRDRIYHDNPN